MGPSGSLQGELLEVRQDGLLIDALPLKEKVVHSPQLVFVPFTVIKGAHFDQFSRLSFSGGPDLSDLAELRVLSRFPQGISSELLQQLVQAQGGRSVLRLAK